LSLSQTCLPFCVPVGVSQAAQRRASAAGVLRHEPMQAKRDTLTATSLAGLDYRQVYFTQRHDTSARHFRTRRGSRSAACAGYARDG
jgi:hypothetical protein